MAQHRSIVVEDGEGNKASVWVLDQKVDGKDLPHDVWHELYRRASGAGWIEEKIPPYVWEGKSLVMLQKEPNAGKVKVLSEEEADPKLKGQDKVIVELLERTRFLEKELKEAKAKGEAPEKKAEPEKKEAEPEKEKVHLVAPKAVPDGLSAEIKTFLQLHWKKAVKGVEAGDHDGILNDLLREPAVGILSPKAKEAVQARFDSIMKG